MTFTDREQTAMKEQLGGFLSFNAPMRRHTSLSIGGPADIYAEPPTLAALEACLKWMRTNDVPITIIGGGTNLLVTDKGIRGAVITLKKLASELTWMKDGKDEVKLTAGAGRSLHSVAHYAVSHGWKGLNFAIGIPGTLGGSIMMNAGTHNGSMGQVVDSLRVISPEGRIATVAKDDLTFSYRQCHICTEGASPYRPVIIIDAILKLAPGDAAELKQEADLLLESRKKSQPIHLKSAGCFFKNPRSGKSAGELIDLAGLKGTTMGGAMVSPLHANYLINTGEATARDMMALKDHVKRIVMDQFGVDLEEEVKIIGE